MDLADGFTCTCTFRGVCWCSCKCIDLCVYLIFGRPWKHLLNAKTWSIQCLQERICYFPCKSCKMKWRLTIICIEEVLQLRKTDKPSWTMDSSAKQVEIWYLTVTESGTQIITYINSRKFHFIYSTPEHHFFSNWLHWLFFYWWPHRQDSQFSQGWSIA